MLELETKVARLSAQLGQTSRPAVAPPERSGNESTLQTLARLKRENDARHDLLLALGVANSAQDLFLRASAVRMATPLHVANNVGTPPSPALASLLGQEDGPAARFPTTDAGRPFDPYPGNIGLFAPSSAAAESVGFPFVKSPDVARTFLDTRDDGQSMAALPAAQPSDALASVEAFASTLEASADWDQHVPTYERLLAALHYPSKASELPFGPIPSLGSFESAGSGVSDDLAQHQNFCTSVWNATVQANDASLAGTTACSIAFSMILKHNARSLPMAQLDYRLRVGYRGGQTVGEECRVVNSVLFSVLAEVS